MRKFKMGIRRFGASLFALLMVCCLTAPAFASGNNWPSSPSAVDFYNHSGSWYVWRSVSKNNSGLSYTAYELLSSPLFESSSYSNWAASGFPRSYSTSSSSYGYTMPSGTTKYLMYSLPYIPMGHSGYWSDLPSFPVGQSYNSSSAYVRFYPVHSGSLSNISDIFNDKSVYCFLTSSGLASGSSFSDQYTNEIINSYPVYVPSYLFPFGSRTSSSSNVNSYGIVGGDNVFWSNPSDSRGVNLGSSHMSNSNMSPFPVNFSIPSSDIGFVFAKRPTSSGVITNPSAFDVTLDFVATLVVPSSLLPSDVKVGDWISHGTMDKLQDQLVNDFDVNSDTLKNSKQNFDSWQNSNTIDTDVADTGLNIINGLMQNVGQFAFVVSLLCFGAVVLRVLIRKAVEG